MNDAIREQLSAFVDGELPENEAELLLRRMGQDARLRQDVAEYLALGRLIRSEPGLAGSDRLHEQIAAAIDDNQGDAGEAVHGASPSRAIRPLAGVAIAATVALVAIIALQQTPGGNELPTDTPLAVAKDVVPAIDAQRERQNQYFLSHSNSSSQLGANGMISRVVTLRFSEDVVVERDHDEAGLADESIEAAAQP